jgi:putative spermidine/putrescine transport system permease protein
MRSGVQRRRNWFDFGLSVWSAIVVVFLVAPIVLVVLNSLGTERFVAFPPTGLTLKWYGDIPQEFVQTFFVSLRVAVMAAIGGSLLAVPAGLSLVRGRHRYRALVDAVVRSPLQVPWLVTGVAFLNYFSILQRQLDIRLIGTLTGLVIAHLIVVTPYLFTTVVARLAKYEDSFEEAAIGLGASTWLTFWKITFPLISPAIFAGAFMAFIISFDNVPVSIFLGGSKTTTFPVQLYFSLEFDLSRMQYAVATLATAFSTILVLIVHRVFGDPGDASVR